MLKYLEHNVNPKQHNTGDCSTRALVGVLKIPYEEALKLQYKESLKIFWDITSKQVMENVLAQFGYVKMKQPRKANGKKYQVGEMDKILTKQQMKEGVLITIAGHHTCITNSVVQDIWDCRNKCVGNYYIKKR